MRKKFNTDRRQKQRYIRYYRLSIESERYTNVKRLQRLTLPTPNRIDIHDNNTAVEVTVQQLYSTAAVLLVEDTQVLPLGAIDERV